MDSNIANQFILASISTFQKVGNVSLKKQGLEYFPRGLKIQAEIATILGITGAYKGQFVIALNEKMSLKIASAILMGVPCTEYGEVAESAVSELGNMIGGEASRLIQELGHTCDITVPSIAKGQNMEVSLYPAGPMFVVNFNCEWGPVQLILKLETN